MKFRTETRTRTVMHGPAGQERPVQESYDVTVPVLPRDWDSIAIKAATGLVLTLTLIAVAWSTISIGALLHGPIGYGAASLFDLAWLVNVLLEWLSRNDPSKRTFSKRLGWALLGVTMGAIAWHGLLAGGVAMAVVGALVSAFAKVLWMGIMRFINRDLNPMDQQWVQGEMSQANAVLALAGVRRQKARMEQRAALELLAAEQMRADLAGWQPETKQEPVQAAPETSGDAVASRRRDAISPAGQGADVRPERETPQVNGADAAPALRPEDVALLRELLAEHDAAQEVPEDDGPEDAEEEQPRISIANGVRTLVKGGVTDPKVVAAALPALIGYQPKPETVTRELRAAKARLNKALAASETGLYL